MEEIDNIVNLLQRHVAGNLTELERKQLEEWSARYPANKILLEDLSDEESLFAGYNSYLEVYNDAVSSRLKRVEDTLMASVIKGGRTKSRFLRWLPYAAAALLVALVGTWFFNNDRSIHHKETTVTSTPDIRPGGNRATLTLTDGRTINLDEARDGIIIGGREITYNDGNPLTGVDGSKEVQIDAKILELSTPKGGTYQVTLPDGTQVWLNAASALKYPPRFSDTARVVTLSGEAYFSVVRDTKRPFKVISMGQEVQVLGTEFNVAAYADENETKTTLIEGAVRLSYLDKGRTIDLSPGEQSILTENGIRKNNVDVSTVTAWKFGRFSFDNKTFTQIMNDMARWYNIDIEYDGAIPTNSFIGDAYRTDNLRTVLRFLESSDIQHRLERGPAGRHRLIISSRKEVTP